MLRKKLLSVEEMLQVEKWIAENWPQIRGNCKTDQELSNRLKLKVEYVSPNTLEKGTEAVLEPSADPAWNGVIRISDVYKDKHFSYMHEIMHYAVDVGVGNRVSKVYARFAKGRKKDRHEQEIDYYAAAGEMPYQEMQEAIRQFDAEGWRADELAFLNMLCTRYHQEPKAVIRRVQEVRRLQRAKVMAT